MQFRSWVVASLTPVALAASLAAAQITGTVKLDGDPPEQAEVNMTQECAAKHTDPVFEEGVVAGEGGELKNVVVSLKEVPSDVTVTAPTDPVVLDQVGCQYTPHVISVMVGQPIKIKNSDPFLHNVHSQSSENPEFNFGQPNVDPGKEVAPFQAAESFRVKCDVHPWMSAYVRVLEHPFSAVTDDKGAYSIKLPDGLADGDYTLVFWQEKLGEREETVTVSGGKGTVDATFDAASAMAPRLANPANVILASSEGGCGEGCKSPTSQPSDAKK